MSYTETANYRPNNPEFQGHDRVWHDETPKHISDEIVSPSAESTINTAENKDQNETLNGMILAEETLKVPEIQPQQFIEIGDSNFYLSNVIKSDVERPLAVLYGVVEQTDGKKLVAPRLMYKSISDGGWRAAYGIEKDLRFIKESRPDSHYTQETKLHPAILESLDKADVVNDHNDSISMKLREMFMEGSPGFDQIDTRTDEIEYVDIGHNTELNKDCLHLLRLIESGRLDHHDRQFISSNYNQEKFTDFFRATNTVYDFMPGFMPDLTQRPVSVRSADHTILGETIIEDYATEFDGTPLVWSMAYKAGENDYSKTWIENIRPADNHVTSYGNYGKIFDAGLLTNKPVEYTDQSTGLELGSEYEPIEGTDMYRLITPLLANLRPIREFKRTKGIPDHLVIR